MFAKRNLLNVFHPSEFFLMKKTSPAVCNFHKIAIKSKSSNFLYPVHVSLPYGKFYSEGKSTSAELRKYKKTLLKEKGNPTRYKASKATEVQHAILYDFISSRTSATDEEWDTLLRDVINVSGYVKEFSINGKVMECMGKKFQNMELARDFLRYMKKKGIKFNQAVVIEFLNTCYACHSKLTEEDLKIVRSFTNYLMSDFKVLDLKLGSSAIRGLFILNDWQKSLEIIENLIKNGCTLNSSVYSTLIVCLLKSKQFELARKIMLECLSKRVKLQQYVYIKWIEVFQHDPNRLEELLIIFKECNIIPRKSICEYLIQVYSQLSSEHRLEGKFTTVKLNGQCKSCKKKLETNDLNEEEFRELRDAFFNRVLVSDDVFKNTTPEELQAFYKVVNNHGPFDVVIDGLNVLYCAGVKKSPQQRAKVLEKVVNTLFDRDKKIFIIGKKHMKHIPQYNMENIEEKSNVFLMNNDSEDDPFMIYATLSSGPKCYFVSRDYLRSEKFRLSDGRLSNLFKEWQLSHQLEPRALVQGIYKPPLQFKLSIQRTAPRSWHIPYHDDDYTGNDLYEQSDLIKWLCLTR